MLRKIYYVSKRFLFDLIFPCNCIGCDYEGKWICDECLQAIDIIKQPFCPECRRTTEVGEFCEYCRPRFMLDGIFICAIFGEGVLKEAIHQFKYNYVFDIGEILGKIMVGKLNYESRINNHELHFDLIVPVPLHKKRLRQRGFNQSEILARIVYRSLGGGLNNQFSARALRRLKYTIPQAELDREQRLENLKGVFEFVGEEKIVRQKNILLVDDVTTTGATLEECARVLKNNGAKSVWGIVLAKGK
jgi:competence protein ComFC